MASCQLVMAKGGGEGVIKTLNRQVRRPPTPQAQFLYNNSTWNEVNIYPLKVRVKRSKKNCKSVHCVQQTREKTVPMPQETFHKHMICTYVNE